MLFIRSLVAGLVGVFALVHRCEPHSARQALLSPFRT